MDDVDLYLNSLSSERKEKLYSVVNYIRSNYSDYIASCGYGPKTKFPVFKNKDSSNYIAIASQKSYISIHFGRYQCPEIVATADQRIKTGVGCAKIPDSVTFPFDKIMQAIDTCFRRA